MINGVVAVAVMVILILMACNGKVMKQFVIKGSVRFLGGASCAAMTLAVIGMAVTSSLKEFVGNQTAEARLGTARPRKVSITKRGENIMASQGGSHDQHVKAGQQSHKNTDTKQASSNNEQQSGSGTRGGSHEQHVKAGQQSHKNS